MTRLNTLISYTFLFCSLISTFMTGCSEDDPTADIIHINLNDADFGYNDPYHLDIDGDGESEFIFDTVLIQGDNGDHLQFKIFPRFNNGVVGEADSVAVLSNGDLIGPDAAPGKVHQILVAKITGNDGISWQGPWKMAQNKYIGIRFKLADNGFYYGWIRISVKMANEKVVVHEMAYNNSVGSKVEAGER